METSESLGYLKGLIDGLDLDPNKKETKVFNAIIDVLENLTEDMEDMTEGLDCDCCDDEEEEYEVECPTCHEKIMVDMDTIEEGKFECPNCGEVLEFDVEFDDDDECDCDCCDHDHE